MKETPRPVRTVRSVTTVVKTWVVLLLFLALKAGGNSSMVGAYKT